MANKEIQINSLSKISQEQLIELYRNGYRIPTTTSLIPTTTNLNTVPKIQSLQAGAVMGVLEVGLIIVGLYTVYKYCKRK